MKLIVLLLLLAAFIWYVFRLQQADAPTGELVLHSAILNVHLAPPPPSLDPILGH